MSDWGLIMSEDRRHVSMVMPDGRVVAEYTVDHEGRKIEPLSEADYLRFRARIGRAAMELWDRLMDGGPLDEHEHAAVVELVKIQLDMGVRGQ